MDTVIYKGKTIILWVADSFSKNFTPVQKYDEEQKIFQAVKRHIDNNLPLDEFHIGNYTEKLAFAYVDGIQLKQ